MTDSPRRTPLPASVQPLRIRAEALLEQLVADALAQFSDSQFVALVTWARDSERTDAELRNLVYYLGVLFRELADDELRSLGDMHEVFEWVSGMHIEDLTA